MSVEIRLCPEEEFHAWLATEAVAWSEHHEEADIVAYRALVEPDRCFAAVDNGAIVGCGAVISSSLGLPGGRVGAGAFTAAGVLPSHRRRGALRGIVMAQLQQSVERGEPVSILGASEAPLYRRYGYGRASEGDHIRIETAHGAFHRAAAEPGRFEHLDEEGFLQVAPAVYTALCEQGDGIPGSIGRPPAYWREHFRDPKHSDGDFGPRRRVVHQGPDGPDGYIVYRLKDRWNHAGIAEWELRVEEMLAPTGDTEISCWRFLLDHSLVRSVSGYRRPLDDAVHHLLVDPRRLVRTPIDDLWVRVLDVAAVLEARRYPVAGSLVLEVDDALMPRVAGRYRLEASPEGAACAPAPGATADLALDAAALGSILLGAVAPSTLHRAGVVDELTPGAAARATALFGWHRAPWNLGEF